MTKAVHVSSKGIQSYTTPWSFIELVGQQFNQNFVVDFAADDVNHRAPFYFTEEIDALKQDWVKTILIAEKDFIAIEASRTPAGWLNPPFKKNFLFAPKCAEEVEKGAVFTTLTLASLGSNWFKDNFKNKAMNLILEDRMIFEGQTDPYPKELILSLWGRGLTGLGWWKWKHLCA
jgi:hypothetical protein